MKIYFNNLNIFTRWKYPYIHQKQLNLLTFQIKSLNICLCSPLVLARLPVKFNNNSTTYTEQIIQSNINPGCWMGKGGGESVCMSKKVRKQVPSAGRYDNIHNMTCYSSVFRRETMTFIRKIFPLNIPLTFLYNSPL